MITTLPTPPKVTKLEGLNPGFRLFAIYHITQRGEKEKYSLLGTPLGLHHIYATSPTGMHNILGDSPWCARNKQGHKINIVVYPGPLILHKDFKKVN